MTPTPPPESGPELDAWFTGLACAWVEYADERGAQAIDYAQLSTTSSEPTTPAQADAGMVADIDARRFVSRLVDRAKEHAGDRAFTAWLLRRVQGLGWAAISRHVKCVECTVPIWVARFDAIVLNMYKGDVIENYLLPDERWAWVPEMDNDYIVTSRGALFSLKTGTLTQIRPTGEGRAKLWKSGREYKPRVGVLIERCFGVEARRTYEASTD